MQKTTAKFHQAFPTVIYEGHIPGHLSALYKSFDDGKFDNTTGKVTGELNGKVLIHQDIRLEPFFKEIRKAVREYLDHFKIDKTTYEINFVKTWFTICDPGQHFPVHYHSCSHISYIYYIQTPGDPLVLHKKNPNEWFGDAFKLIKENGYCNGDGYAIGPKVVISGDGQGANARATVNTTTGGINAVAIVDSGNNYSNATISIVANNTGLSITPTSLTPIVGPVGGHGADSIKELGGYYVLTNARLEYSESNNFTTNNDFRKVGIVAQPEFANGDIATASVADQATTLILKSWNGTQYSADELVTGSVSGATGRVVDFTSNPIIACIFLSALIIVYLILF